jgi:hypothetical protein
LAEAMARAKAGEATAGGLAGGKPLVISDYSDNPGSAPMAMPPIFCAPCSMPA